MLLFVAAFVRMRDGIEVSEVEHAGKEHPVLRSVFVISSAWFCNGTYISCSGVSICLPVLFVTDPRG